MMQCLTSNTHKEQFGSVLCTLLFFFSFWLVKLVTTKTTFFCLCLCRCSLFAPDDGLFNLPMCSKCTLHNLFFKRFSLKSKTNELTLHLERSGPPVPSMMRRETEYRLNGSKGLERTAPFSLCQRNQPISRNISTVKVNSVLATAVKKAFCVVSGYFWCRGFVERKRYLPLPQIKADLSLHGVRSWKHCVPRSVSWIGDGGLEESGGLRIKQENLFSFFNWKKLGWCHAFETKGEILRKTWNIATLSKGLPNCIK